jgi:hypothetical protein
MSVEIKEMTLQNKDKGNSVKVVAVHADYPPKLKSEVSLGDSFSKERYEHTIFSVPLLLFIGILGQIPSWQYPAIKDTP